MRADRNNAPSHGDGKPTKRRFPIMPVCTAASMIVAACVALFVWFVMGRYESGILDVCAVQQDGYVQLVLDQINLRENRDDEEIIQNILGTLDASSSKYWTFSKEKDMLFVKDVLETNKYKGLTASSYYDSESAAAFFSSLSLNFVTHDSIMVDGVEYIASGVAFQYRGSVYRLCLLTNRMVLLDNNAFLGAKTELSLAVGVVLILLCLSVMWLSRMISQLRSAEDGHLLMIEQLNEKLLLMNERFSEHDLHDSRFNLWRQEAFHGFLEKLSARGAAPLSFVKLRCAGEEGRRRFLEFSHVMLDKNVLKFQWGSDALLFLFVQVSDGVVQEQIAPLLEYDGVTLLQQFVVKTPGEFQLEAIEEALNGGETA